MQGGGPTGNFFRLNDDTYSGPQPHVMLFDDPLPVSLGNQIRASFDFRITSVYGNANGHVFGLYPSSTYLTPEDALFADDQGRGLPGVLHIQFDVFNNYKGGPDPSRRAIEPNANHIELSYDGDGNTIGDAWIDTRNAPFILSDGQFHTAVMTIDQAAGGALVGLNVEDAGIHYAVFDNLFVPGFDFGTDYRFGLFSTWGAERSLHDVDNILVEVHGDQASIPEPRSGLAAALIAALFTFRLGGKRMRSRKTS